MSGEIYGSAIPTKEPRRPGESMYDFLKRRGVDMGWYDRAKANRPAGTLSRSGPAPLFDSICGRLSIYMLKKDGSLWTVDNGEPYVKVRDTGKEIAKDIFVCICCKAQGESMDIKHKLISIGAKREEAEREDARDRADLARDYRVLQGGADL